MRFPCRHILFLIVMLVLLPACPVLAQVREGDVEDRCPSGGSFAVLNDRAFEMPAPAYPDEVREKGIAGGVAVFVVVDEEGRVRKARACTGPGKLRRPAEDAAYKARLRPTMLSGVAVKVRGMLTYTFPPGKKSRAMRTR